MWDCKTPRPAPGRAATARAAVGRLNRGFAGSHGCVDESAHFVSMNAASDGPFAIGVWELATTAGLATKGLMILSKTVRAQWLLMATLAALFPLEEGQCGTNGDSPELFGPTNLWVVRLTMDEGAWARLEPVNDDRRGSPRPPGGPREEGPGGPIRPGDDRGGRGFRGPGNPGGPPREFPWAECTFECGGQRLTNVAIRFKGNSSFAMSRQSLKRPFRLDFNRGHKGRQFLGLKALSLNNNFNDSTQLREALGYEVCRQAGVPAPRTAFARVYLTVPGQRTNDLLGLYTLAEPVDNQFLQSRFGTKKGLLLKPERLPSLEYLGENWSAYTNRYGPKTEAKPADEQRFIDLTRFIARAEDRALETDLPAKLDLDNFLRYVAVNALLANYDSFVGNGHNYYFFQPADGGKASFIPWDLNEAFGGHPPLGPRMRQAEFSVLRPQAGQNRLIDRVLANPKWNEAYRRELTNLLANACEPNRLKALAARMAAVTGETVLTESPLANAMFQRVALGRMNVPIPTGGNDRLAGPPRVDRQEPSLAEWITVRMQNAADELQGKRTGVRPQVRGGPPGFGPP